MNYPVVGIKREIKNILKIISEQFKVFLPFIVPLKRSSQRRSKMECKLDLRGYNCPIPILKAREALSKTDIVTVVVDELTAKEAILQFAKAHSYSIQVKSKGREHHIHINKYR